MKFFIFIFTAFVFVGCSATVKGVKEDTKNAVDWSKQKVNDAATVIKEKTE
jgi:hypothetical protein